ncbi:Fur family transcriptional regulator [Kozakia baliensis]|uniref:Fur family transcriptional regulator n=1 Tax=Kozakia baliensis TaxID=153496 RepID=UPI000566558E|nr:Fur family transcriptional regulator [Kozakia baliensis]AOX20822.1 hypothetical protein A0U90_11640 [Kozakia baliensis]
MLEKLPTLGDEPFSPKTEAQLDRAEHRCVAHGGRLTGTRRQVLGFILENPKPCGAYEILDWLRGYQRNAAPPTVYRALDFLTAHGLIHRIERLAAFTGCTHRLECAHGEECAHRAQFLICKHCGSVQELEDQHIGAALSKAARAVDFMPTHSTVEIEGVCHLCRKTHS